MSFFRWLLNSTNVARAAGAPVAANNPLNVMTRGMNPAWRTPGFNPNAPMPGVMTGPGGFGGIGGQIPFPRSPWLSQGQRPGGRLPLKRFPRMQSALETLRGAVGSIDPLAVGLLASSGPRPVGTSSFGSRLGEAFQFANQIEDSRTRQEAVRRELAELERREKAGADIGALIESLSKGTEGAAPALNKQQAAMLSTVARYDPGAAAQMLGKIPGLLEPVDEPGLSETGEKLRDVRDVLGRDLTEREALTLSGGGSLFEARESDADKPLSPTDLVRVRRPDGSPLPFGTTAAEAEAAGARVYSDSELTAQRSVSRALGTLDTLEQMAVGPDGVFRDEGGSILTNNILSRLGSGLANGIGWLLGTEDSVRREVFTDTARGSISSLVRSFGEAGALSDGDVARALGLIPALGSTPDTEEKAKAKFAELRKIIERGVNNLGGRQDGSRVDLGGGVTLEWEQ